MRHPLWWLLSALSLLLTSWYLLRVTGAPAQSESAQPATLEVGGKTGPAPGHVAVVAPQTTQPVREVRVRVGDDVKKDQVILVQDDDEHRADVQVKQAEVAAARAKVAELKAQMHGADKDQAVANLKRAQADLENAKKSYDRIEQLFRQGSIGEKAQRDARTEYLKAVETERIAADRLAAIVGEQMHRKLEAAEADIARAQAALARAEAELDNHVLRARMPGTVTRLSAVPGMVGLPGLAQWGEIIDASVLEVSCDVPAAQASGLSMGQSVDIHGPGGLELGGKIFAIGVAQISGAVPVRVHVDNPQRKLAVHVPVRARFRQQ